MSESPILNAVAKESTGFRVLVLAVQRVAEFRVPRAVREMVRGRDRGLEKM